MPKLKRLKLIAVVFIVLALLLVLVAPFIVNAAGETWGSYNDPTHSNPDDTFSGDEDTVYMYGTGFTTYNFYKVDYYDGSDQDVAIDTTWTDTGALESDYYLPVDQTAAAGLWHSVVFDTTGDIPNNYSDALSDPDYVIDDSFTVEASAIPEFPTVIAIIVAMGLCLGIYYWMRKRYHRQVVMA